MYNLTKIGFKIGYNLFGKSKRIPVNTITEATLDNQNNNNYNNQHRGNHRENPNDQEKIVRELLKKLREDEKAMLDKFRLDDRHLELQEGIWRIEGFQLGIKAWMWTCLLGILSLSAIVVWFEYIGKPNQEERVKTYLENNKLKGFRDE